MLVPPSGQKEERKILLEVRTQESGGWEDRTDRKTWGCFCLWRMCGRLKYYCFL
jgi:hypothetical protein